MTSVIWWIRRDLRLGDNQALAAAIERGDSIVPVFILDPKLLASTKVSQRRLAFLFDGLKSLDVDLRRRGSSLVVRQGNPLEVLHTLMDETGATGIYAESDVSVYARQRDDKVMHALPLHLTPGVTVHPVEVLHKPDGLPYTVFTPFSRMWHSLPLTQMPLPAPERISTPAAIQSLEIPDLLSYSAESNFTAGEAEAQRRLSKFADSAINSYTEEHNRMDLDGTSGLSPYLRFGMLSARQATWVAKEAIALAGQATARQGAQTWLTELIWREFYAAILYYFPDVSRTAFRPALRSLAWHEDPSGFSAWSQGRTGYPVVDAAMRQLNATGWMHNRARMIAASFLVKDLLINWKQGERYFMQNLLDGDPASNNGGWQWTAGTGTDAAPYFRVFNPVLQGVKFDPHGAYVRHWVAELSAVPDAFIHEPWQMPIELQKQVGCIIGIDYPVPIVDHALARQRVLAIYRRAGK